ncbi:hypothetical protein [Streptomyces sp. NPDC048172]|uniref:hypothetical protein n=1 Tax=Streptomyces sp. NPDC048172 TaxID=3365505 RepID=UPI00371A20E3
MSTFEIRVLCQEGEADAVVGALRETFDTGPVRRYPARSDKGRVRLYVTAQHPADPGRWPAPEDAYRLAPSLDAERAWLKSEAREKTTLGVLVSRVFWLRDAAVRDRAALPHPEDAEAARDANRAARELVCWDQSDLEPEETFSIVSDPRGYVRREYQAWRECQQASEYADA